jgi:hypothetical protein
MQIWVAVSSEDARLTCQRLEDGMDGGSSAHPEGGKARITLFNILLQ